MLNPGQFSPTSALVLLLTLTLPDASVTQQSTCNVPPQNGVNALVCEKPNPNCNIITSGLIDGEQEEIISVHNQDRSQVALGQLDSFPPAKNMYQLIWNDEIAESAQAHANQCGWSLGPGSHSSLDQRRTEHFSFIGENLAHAAITANISVRNWKTHIQNWFKEYQYYPPESVSSFQPPPGPNQVAHFTQVVWATTRYVGCGYTYYTLKGDTSKFKFQHFYVCQYAPMGNVKPLPVYEPGETCSDCPQGTSFDKDRFAGRRNGEDSEEITSVEATWQHLQSSRKHSPRNRGPGSNGSKSTATTRATTGQHDDQTKVTPRRRGRQPRANTPKLSSEKTRTRKMRNGSPLGTMPLPGQAASITVLVLLTAVNLPHVYTARQKTCSVPKQNGINAAICEKPNPRCNIMVSGLADGDREQIISLHNRDRSQVARGELDGFPPAKNMYKLVWNEEIAQSAQAYANQCGEGRGPGRHSSPEQRRTEHFSSLGENIAHEAFTANITMRRWKVHIQNWFEEYQYYPPEAVSSFQPPSGPEVTHFTQEDYVSMI
ncbi:hypothetical protein HPB50_008873 [Hyalomma asiaticum]|uniref:Uncharacterized protein n=1 Tax=Hyalomma asiaticum TaxID=266040 RepID=A0ACB7T952_HYAAI|nr:hypothetical protein HPB50_008873 [Hyalomma asiaticum]